MLRLLGDVLLSAGCIAYLGPYTVSYRRDIVVVWNKRAEELSKFHSTILWLKVKRLCTTYPIKGIRAVSDKRIFCAYTVVSAYAQHKALQKKGLA